MPARSSNEATRTRESTARRGSCTLRRVSKPPKNATLTGPLRSMKASGLSLLRCTQRFVSAASRSPKKGNRACNRSGSKPAEEKKSKSSDTDGRVVGQAQFRHKVQNRMERHPVPARITFGIRSGYPGAGRRLLACQGCFSGGHLDHFDADGAPHLSINCARSTARTGDGSASRLVGLRPPAGTR